MIQFIDESESSDDDSAELNKIQQLTQKHYHLLIMMINFIELNNLILFVIKMELLTNVMIYL